MIPTREMRVEVFDPVILYFDQIEAIYEIIESAQAERIEIIAGTTQLESLQALKVLDAEALNQLTFKTVGTPNINLKFEEKRVLLYSAEDSGYEILKKIRAILSKSKRRQEISFPMFFLGAFALLAAVAVFVAASLWPNPLLAYLAVMVVVGVVGSYAASRRSTPFIGTVVYLDSMQTYLSSRRRTSREIKIAAAAALAGFAAIFVLQQVL